MDAKDLRINAVSSEHNNDGSKYAQSNSALECHRNKLYHDIGSNSMAKVDVPASRPCAVIGPDRVVPPPATNDAYLKKSAVDPWPCPDNAFRGPPDYPHRLSAYHNPTRNISPRQTFQENMQRIMVPPTYNSAKLNDDSSFANISERNSILSKNTKLPLEGKYCDVPYNVNTVNEPKIVRNSDVCVSSVNPTLARTAPPGWPAGSVSLQSQRTLGAPELYQYPEYPSCAGPRPAAMPRLHRTVQEEPSYVYPEPYYQDGNMRYKPYPPPKERYPQARYEYIGNYSNPYHPPSPFPPHKYELQKQIHHPYSTYTPLKFMENRMADPLMDGYQRPNQQANYNIAYHNQIIHPTYGPMLGNPQNKMHVYPSDGKMKTIPLSGNKMYLDYENTRNKSFPVSDNYFVNEMARVHTMKSQVGMTNHSTANMYLMPPHPYFKKDNPSMRTYEYMSHLKNMDPSLNINNPLLRHSSRFSPSSVAISPTDSNASSDTTHTHGALQEDCGYVSQSSTASVRSSDAGLSRHPHEFYRRYDVRYTPVIQTSPIQSNPELHGHSNVGSKKKNIDVRQFLQMWNEGDEETDNSNGKELVIQTPARDGVHKNHEVINNNKDNNQEPLYVLGLVNVPSEELSKYEHIQKVSKLPENIKGYNSIELLNQFEEAIQSSKINCFKPPASRNFSTPTNRSMLKTSTDLIQRPLSPLDVEAKISQSVIHKDVGCNFEIKPCSPKMLNVEIAAPIQNILNERLIEKVANPHMIRSPLLSGIDENIDNYNVVRQDHLTRNDNEKNSSCKMVKTQFSSERPMDSIKTNYSLQDLESNSGVCLASLPRLDNDIELHFPEVNQQFINANKSPITQTSFDDLPTLKANETSEKQMPKDSEALLASTNSQFSPINDIEKETMKLSKYRKLKPMEKIKQTDKREDGSWFINKTIRTDSVIIKNPDNLKMSEELADSPVNEIQQTPINLTSYCNDISDVDNDIKSEIRKTGNFNIGNTSFDDAIDFSLNKPDNSIFDYKNDSEMYRNNDSTINKHTQYKDNCDNESPILKDFGNRIEVTLQSESNHIDLNVESDKTIFEEIPCHDQHLKSLPLISPGCNDSNKEFQNSNSCSDSNEDVPSSQMKKEDHSLASVFKVETELDPSSLDISDESTNKNEASPVIDDIDNIDPNCDAHIRDNVNEDNINNGDINCAENISCTLSQNEMIYCSFAEGSTTPKNGVGKSLNNSINLLSIQTDADTNIHTQISEVEPIIANNLLNDSHEEVLLENLHLEKNNGQSNSTFDDLEHLIVSNENSVNETSEEIMIQDLSKTEPLDGSHRMLLQSKEEPRDSFCAHSDSGDNISKPMKTSYRSKELYSPWFQKLILRIEGICSSTNNNMGARDDHVKGIIVDSKPRGLGNELYGADKEPVSLISIAKCSKSDVNLERGDTQIGDKENVHANFLKVLPDQNVMLTNTTPLEELKDAAEGNTALTGNKTSKSCVLMQDEYECEGTSTCNVDNVLENENTSAFEDRRNNLKCDSSFDIVKLASVEECTEVDDSGVNDYASQTKIEKSRKDIPNDNYSFELLSKLNFDEHCEENSSNTVIPTSVEKITEIDDPEVNDPVTHTKIEKNRKDIPKGNYSWEHSSKLNVDEHCEENAGIEGVENIRKKLLGRRQIPLKRSLSESALSFCADEFAEADGTHSFWPHKRRKYRESNCGLITENLCSILHSNRRNSISVSAYNEENVSICIFIDNNCIITEQNEEEPKISYAEIPENCFSEVQNEVEAEFEVESSEMLIESDLQQDVPDCITLNEPSILECEEEKNTHESWVDDVACVETVVSDEIAEDVTIESSPPSPKFNDYSDNEESSLFSSNVNSYTDNIIYHDKMFPDDSQLIDLYRPSQIDRAYQGIKDCNKYYDKESLERILSESNSRQGSPCSLDPPNSLLFLTETLNSFKSPDDKENVGLREISSPQNTRSFIDDIASETGAEEAVNHLILDKTQDDTVHSCESSIDNVFSYKEIEEPTNCITSSSPEVSSTTPEERNTSILLKITNYKGSRISQINNAVDKNKINKFTKEEEFVPTRPSLPLKRPLITKAAQKYIPPLKESTRDLKVKLSLPQQSLLKLKQLKKSKDEPKLNKTNITLPKTVKKPKPKFEDVLKSIDEVQFKMHKEKSKKCKKVVPKVVIKKTQNGSHYASTSNKDVYNPDLTGRKWQPWVFLEKNNFIDKMAIKKKTRAIFNHRKKSYVLAEKFRKYKSVNNAKFVITQPKQDQTSAGHLKYTIRLKHSY